MCGTPDASHLCSAPIRKLTHHGPWPLSISAFLATPLCNAYIMCRCCMCCSMCIRRGNNPSYVPTPSLQSPYIVLRTQLAAIASKLKHAGKPIPIVFPATPFHRNASRSDFRASKMEQVSQTCVRRRNAQGPLLTDTITTSTTLHLMSSCPSCVQENTS